MDDDNALCPRCRKPFSPDMAGTSRADHSVAICSRCCTAEAQWARGGFTWSPSEWPLPIDDHNFDWSDLEYIAGFVAVVVAALSEDAKAEAVGTEVNQRADDAVRILRTKAHRAGINLPEDTFAAAHMQFVQEFTD